MQAFALSPRYLETRANLEMLVVAASLSLAQKSRFSQTGNLTTFSDIPLNLSLGRAVKGIVAGKSPFVCRSTDGQDLPNLRCISTGAAFGCWALMSSPYSQNCWMLFAI